jgi:hypothetical protein
MFALTEDVDLGENTMLKKGSWEKDVQMNDFRFELNLYKICRTYLSMCAKRLMKFCQFIAQKDIFIFAY